MNIIIRKADMSDAKDIVRININSWKDTYKDIFPNEFLDSLDSKFDDTVNKCINKIDEYVVALNNNEVVGFIRYGLNKKDYSNEYAEVYSLYIDSAFRGNNIGKQLLEYVFNDIKKKYNYCLISTLVENRANSFYQRNGGVIIDNCDFKLMDKYYKENIYLFVL